MIYLLALICLALPAYLIRFNVAGIPSTALEVLIYLVFIVGLFNIKQAQRIPWKQWLPVGLILLAAVISTLISPDKRVALGQLKAFFIDPIIVWWLVSSFIKKEDFNWLLAGLGGSGLIVSLHAIYQKMIGNVTVDNRVVGIFGYSPNYLALFLAPIVVITLIYNVEFRMQNWKKNALLVIGYWLLVITDLYALYLSGSRGGLLAVGGGIIIYAILKFWPLIKKEFWLKTSLIIAALLTIVVVAWVFRPDFSLRGDVPTRVISSNNVRVMIWQASIELGSKHPALGVGLGNFQNSFSDLTIKRINFDNYIIPWAASPHNLFLAFWLETGLLGLIGLLWLIINAIKKGIQNLDAQKTIVLAGLATIIIFGFVDTPYFKNDLSVLFWLVIAAI